MEHYNLTNQQMRLVAAIADELTNGSNYYLEDNPGYASVRRITFSQGREAYSEVWVGRLSRTDLQALTREKFLVHLGGLRYRVETNALLDAVRNNFEKRVDADNQLVEEPLGEQLPTLSGNGLDPSEDVPNHPEHRTIATGKSGSAQMSTAPTAFISYSWDSEQHKRWVKELATRLRRDGIDVKLDQWHTAPGDPLPKFMETSIRDNDFVLIICTPSYKAKSESRKGGVGYEGNIITGELFAKQNRRKYIPILREGDWLTATPVWLSGAYGLVFVGDYPEQTYQELVATLKGQREPAPPLGTSETASTWMHRAPSVAQDDEGWQDIRITGVILDEVTSPKNDGSRGSALYKVPFQLSRRPTDEWKRLFLYNFDHPPSFTMMHRPGIARIIGDKLILDGTTIEEIEKYHQKTLKLVVKETNQKIREYEQEKAAQARATRDKEQEHRKNLNDIAGKLDFDSDET